jgi:hypothetical protein
VLRSGVAARRRVRQAELTVSNTSYLSGKRRGAVLSEQVWTLNGKVVKYSLAYIDHRLCSADNGRVLGYDNSHEHHHRHWMGEVSAVEFTTYEAQLERFEREVQELWRQQDEK